MTTHTDVKKSRRTFILVIVAFIAPVLLAKLALDGDWFNRGSTNKGQLVEGLTLNDFNLEQTKPEPQWLIVYALPPVCEKQCLNTLKGINNTHIALGKELGRISPMAVSQGTFPAAGKESAYSRYWLFKEDTPVDNKLVQKNKVWIADPLGNIMLSFDLPASEQAVPAFGKAMLADLKKLLKYSKIG